MPRQDHEPHRPMRRFPSVTTGISLVQMRPKLAFQLRAVFGDVRAIEMLFETLLWRQQGSCPA